MKIRWNNSPRREGQWWCVKQVFKADPLPSPWPHHPPASPPTLLPKPLCWALALFQVLIGWNHFSHRPNARHWFRSKMLCCAVMWAKGCWLQVVASSDGKASSSLLPHQHKLGTPAITKFLRLLQTALDIQSLIRFDNAECSQFSGRF